VGRGGDRSLVDTAGHLRQNLTLQGSHSPVGDMLEWETEGTVGPLLDTAFN
jgi:hypothetical protein